MDSNPGGQRARAKVAEKVLPFVPYGGAEGIRTPAPLNAIEVLATCLLSRRLYLVAYPVITAPLCRTSRSTFSRIASSSHTPTALPEALAACLAEVAMAGSTLTTKFGLTPVLGLPVLGATAPPY